MQQDEQGFGFHPVESDVARVGQPLRLVAVQLGFRNGLTISLSPQALGEMQDKLNLM